MEYTFLQIPKLLFTEEYSTLSPVAKLLYGFLLERHQMSLRNNWHDKSGDTYIYFPTQAVKNSLNVSINTATKLLRELELVGLIKKELQGAGKPCKIKIVDLSHATPSKKEERERPVKKQSKPDKYANMRTYDIKEVEALFNKPLY